MTGDDLLVKMFIEYLLMIFFIFFHCQKNEAKKASIAYFQQSPSTES